MDRAAIQPVVWIIDSQQWPRANLCAELIERGFNAIGFIEISQAMAMLGDPDHVKPRLIVLELRGQSFSQNDLDVLAESGIPAVAIGGEVELNEKSIRKLKWAAVLQRPLSIGNVADVVEGLLNRKEKNP